ncbi:MAG: hypothetical protein M5U08_13830 [Burkholderiales bacterium]|nr:hypothetical protein [Burkholderiales bacterium]
MTAATRCSCSARARRRSRRSRAARTRWCQVCQIRPLARDDHACFTCEACAAAQEHVVAMTIDHVDASTSYDVATCRCGWSDSVRRTAASAAEMDARVRAHWQAVVAEPDRPPELQPPAPPAPADDGLEMPEFLRRRAPDRPTPEAAR